MLCYKKCVLKASRRLLFSLFIINQTKSVDSKQGGSYFSLLICFTTKNVCSKQLGHCFLFYSSLINIVHLRWFYYEFYKTSLKILFSLFSKLYKTSLNGSFLVYLLTFIRLPLTTALDLTFISILIPLKLWNLSFGSSELRFQFWFIRSNKSMDWNYCLLKLQLIGVLIEVSAF